MFNLPIRTWILNAAAVFSGQHGAITRQADQAGCSRQTVYQHAHKLEQRLGAEPAQACLHLRRLQGLVDDGIELGDDAGGRSRRRRRSPAGASAHQPMQHVADSSDIVVGDAAVKTAGTPFRQPRGAHVCRHGVGLYGTDPEHMPRAHRR